MKSVNSNKRHVVDAIFNENDNVNIESKKKYYNRNFVFI